MEAKAERLKSLIMEMRGGQGLRAFARVIGVSPGALHNWQEGVNQPDKNGLQKLARLKGWTVDELSAYLDGESLPARAEISMPALREAIKKLSADQALELIEIAIPVARGRHLDTLHRNATIAFSKGAETMNFSQLLQHFLATVSPDIVEELLIEKRLQKCRLGELVAGAYPTNDDLKKIGAMMRQADFRDSYGKPYTIERLEAIRAGSTITNGANR